MQRLMCLSRECAELDLEKEIPTGVRRGWHTDVWDVLDTLPDYADVVIGGFPCQDISVNGKCAGINGAKSGLYKAMVEAVKRLKPKIFVAENVKGLLMRNNRASLEKVISDFTRTDVWKLIDLVIQYAQNATEIYNFTTVNQEEFRCGKQLEFSLFQTILFFSLSFAKRSVRLAMLFHLCYRGILQRLYLMY